jgi:hypothetical protein
VLEAAVSPAVSAHLAALADQLADDADYWAAKVDRWLAAEPGAPLALGRDRLREAPPALRRRLLAEAWRRAVVALGSLPPEPSRAPFVAFDGLAAAPPGAACHPAPGTEVHLPGGLVAIRHRDSIELTRRP